jgi:hypothetical protein
VSNVIKFFVVLGGTILLAGCFGGNDVECDSSVTTMRIIGDFDAHLSEVLPEGAAKYVSSIEVTEVVTLEANKEAKTRSCEAKVVVHTNVSDVLAYQEIKYANQSVSGGEETTRTVYEYIDTFQYIGKNVVDIIKEPYQKGVAKEAGFGSYEEYQEFEGAKRRLARSIKELAELAVEISQVDADIQEISQKVAPVEAAIRDGKTVMLTNRYFSMQPVLVKVGSGERSGFDRNLTFSTELENTSSITFDTLYMNADVYINGQQTPFQTNQFTTVTPVEGFKPGEMRKVKISVSGSIGIVEDFLSTTAWKEAKSIQILFVPSKYTDSNGREGQIGQYYDAFSFRNKNKGDPILWTKYRQLTDELQKKSARKAQLEEQVAKDASLVGGRASRSPSN